MVTELIETSPVVLQGHAGVIVKAVFAAVWAGGVAALIWSVVAALQPVAGAALPG